MNLIDKLVHNQVCRIEHSVFTRIKTIKAAIRTLDYTDGIEVKCADDVRVLLHYEPQELRKEIIDSVTRAMQKRY